VLADGSKDRHNVGNIQSFHEFSGVSNSYLILALVAIFTILQCKLFHKFTKPNSSLLVMISILRLFLRDDLT
jgi:hypothetical protein